jgi:coatomer subunit beta'
LALLTGNIKLAEQCFLASDDHNSLLLIYSSSSNRAGLKVVAQRAEAAGKFNVAYQCYNLLADKEKCLDILLKSKKISEAAFFARAYLPERADEILVLWQEFMQQHRPTYRPESIDSQTYAQ